MVVHVNEYEEIYNITLRNILGEYETAILWSFLVL